MNKLAETRQDFPVLTGHKALVYFDNACMSLKPNVVIEAVNDYYRNFSSCAGRSSHQLSLEVSRRVAECRLALARYIGARRSEEIIFTRNTTESINLLANSLGLRKGDVVLLSDKEHNSNLIPWLKLQDKIGIEVKVVLSKQDGTFDLEKFNQMVSGAKLVSMVHTSNLDGAQTPIKEIIKIAHDKGVLTFFDLAQTMLHERIDVRELDVDFAAFSGHKILGPTGTGILYGKYELLEKLDTFIVGGSTVANSTYSDFELLPVPERFEAGLQDYAGIIGLTEAVKYLESLDFAEIRKHELALNTYITNELKKFPEVKIIGPEDPALRTGVIDFYIPGKSMHQFALLLDEMAGIATRSGRHCVHAWFNVHGIENALRISLAFYNTHEEADIFVENFKKVMSIF